MRLLISLSLLAAAAQAASLPYFSVLSDEPGAWPELLSSIGFQQQPAAVARVLVARAGAAASPEWKSRVEQGAVLVLEGESPLAATFGFRAGGKRVRVNSVSDVHNPALSIIWEKGMDLPVFETPPGAQVFARDTNTPHKLPAVCPVE